MLRGVVSEQGISQAAVVVGGLTWGQWAVKIGELLMDCEVKLYPPEELDLALDWISR